MTDRKGPVLIELDAPAAETPASAAPVPELTHDGPTGQAMQTVATLATRRPSRLARLFWAALTGLVGFAASVAAWDFVNGLLDRNPILGTIALVLVGAFVLALILMALRELAGIARLRRLDGLRQEAEAALNSGELAAARAVTDRIERLYANRPDLDWARSRFSDRRGDVLDADGLFGLAEAEYLAPLDAQARKEIEAAARQVATVTALVPIALADLFVALTANLRMIRRIAEIYGGRGGLLGNWRLTRAVMTHLVATGAVAVGDDMLEPLVGGGILGKLSRRFGEGLVNGALTTRVGVAAIEVCRPLPFLRQPRPSVRKLVQSALKGVVSKARD